MSLSTLTLVASPTISTGRDASGKWQLYRNGNQVQVHGVGGEQHLELTAALGANTIRTWGIPSLEKLDKGKPLVDRAQDLGISIVAGIWLKHERHGFNYGDPAFLQAQRDEVRAAIRRYRDHPAILVWGLGNEMEHTVGPGDPLRIWREIEILARIIKEEDPHRPIVTILAGAAVEKIRAVRENCPGIDIIGINSYGPAVLVTHALDEAGWTGPFMLTEFGPRGQWEILQAPWGAPIEPRMGEKIASYVGAHRAALADPQQRCLGTFCFTWGQKQEATATWFGMFLATGEKTPLVDAMSYEFTGRWPANRSPQLRTFKVPFALERVPAGAEFTVTAEARDPDGDPVSYEWIVVAESTDRKSGGDAEKIPRSFPECTVSADGGSAVIRTPAQPGAYRLFIYVRDAHGGGTTENIPFWVQP
ncbi:MAG: glycoside hydrolase family 2 TIM barrel-domain containing protein [Candidatus Didemnitutus sp.]|nr:glycoside hydrolase family 2 TIM barrel-domain containing protein [Candidatus Didemnitutus sp.]